jgi:hypothetical protein
MRVFISHSSADRGLARELAARLSEDGAEAWSDENLFPGDNWGLELGKALEQSDAMVVLISPEAAKSEWVRHEIAYAVKSPRFENRLIPVQVRPTGNMPWVLGMFPAIVADGDAAEISRRVIQRLQEAGEVAR